MSPHAIKNISVANFQTHLKHGLIFVDGDTESKGIFKFDKRVK
jgi:hypothetical protein